MAAAPVPPLPTSDAAPAPLSQGARIIDTFIAPSKTFTDLRRSASWWAPWLVISVISIIFILAIAKQVGFEQVNRNTIAQSPRQAEQFDKLPPDQQAARLRIGSKFIAVFGYASPAFILLYCLIGSLVVWLVFKLALGAETSFSQAYAIMMYSWLPGIFGAILATISLFAGANPEGFDINNPAGTNLAYYLDAATTGKFLRSLASALDVFTIWTIVLVGIGFACTSKVKRSTSITVVVVCYLVYKVAGASLAAAFS
jgi:Yip1 domain